MKSSSFKTGLIAALVSALVAAGAAVATTQTFVLGKTNTVNATSAVTNGTNTINDKLMQFTNMSIGTGATALGLNVANGHAPFAVNSTTKVANLNADQLDGRDSGYFLAGTTVRRFGPVTVAPSGGFDLMTIGQLTIVGQCIYDSDLNGEIADLDLRTSAAGSAYADVTTSGTTHSSAAMNAGGQIYPLGGFTGAAGTQTFTPVTGEALGQNGQELFYNLYVGQNAAGASGNNCTFGGSIVVK